MTHHRSLMAALAAALLTAGCGAGPADAPDTTRSDAPVAAETAPAGPTGRIRGIVRFQGELPEPATDPITENQDVCGDSASLPRLVLGEDNGVGHAFVYLEDAPANGAPRPVESLLVDQHDCRYVPHTLAVRVGTALEVVNSDPILHNVHGFALAEEGPRTVFNIAQPVQGQQNTLPTLTEPGIVHFTCEAGHPWMSAYVFVADHPYVAVTGDNGEFVLDDVPVGTYQIAMWHEGIRLERNLKTLQRYEYEEPYESTQEVVVTEGEETLVDFDLSLRAP